MSTATASRAASNVISISLAPSYAEHMLRANGRWSEFALICWSPEKAAEFVVALSEKGLDAKARGRVVTARYNLDDEEQRHVPVNMAVVATANSYAEPDQVFQTLTLHDGDPAQAEVLSI